MKTEREFIDRYEALGLEILERHGFAVPVEPGARRAPTSRQALAKNRSLRALGAVTDLQQWLVDDDARVRDAAREGLRKVLYVAYTGHHEEPVPVSGTLTRLPDLALAQLTRPRLGPDRPPPAWYSPVGGARVRKAAVAGTLLGAAAAAAALVAGSLWVVPLLAVTALLDIFDGAFARLTRLRDPHLRWLSCVASQAADMALIAGVAAAEYSHGRPVLASCTVAAMLATLFAAFVRVSALQAGYRFWRSPHERLIRWLAVLSYVSADTVGATSIGAIFIIALLLTTAGFELFRVLRGVRSVASKYGGLFVLNDDHTVDSWRLEDGQDTLRPAAHRLRRGKAPVR